MRNETYYWEIANSPDASPFLAGTKTFGEVDPIYLVDQFNGKKPFLINEEYLTNKKLEFQVFGCTLLDSNVVDAIDRRVLGGKISDGVEGLIRFISSNGWDINPMFYYLEHFAKSPLADFEPNALRRTRALLKIHAMDDKHFLETGEIKSHPEAVEYYTSTYKVKSMDEVAEARVAEFISKQHRRDLQETVEAIQIALIKMVLIQKMEIPKASPLEKYEEFRRFLVEDLGILLAREAHFAVHYFCDRAGAMLGIQSNTKFQRALEIIRSTSWDLLFLRVPEMSLTGAPTLMSVSYIATHEKRLQELARLYTVGHILCYEGKFSPEVGYSTKDLPEELQEVVSSDYEFQQSMALDPSRKVLTVPVGLKSALETALAYFCRNAA
jgi:hypothetical protein